MEDCGYHPTNDPDNCFIIAAVWYILCNPDKKDDIERLEKVIKEIKNGELKLKKFIPIERFLKEGLE